MAIEDAAERAGAAIQELGGKAQASAAHINMLVNTLQAMTIGSANGDGRGDNSPGMVSTRQGLLLSKLLQDGIFNDRAFLDRLAREMGQRMDEFDLVTTLQHAIERRQAGPFLAAFERAVFGSNNPIRSGRGGVEGSR